MIDAAFVRSVRTTYKRLVAAHPDAHCELTHETPFQLIVATALSAQSTDVQVNKVTEGLFAAYPDARSLAHATQEQVEARINRLGMFRQKAKNLIGMAQALVRDHDGDVPQTIEQLVELPGVGRKTANVVLGVAFQAPVGVVVDTHVQRITQRLGWTQQASPDKIERDLMQLLPRSEWDRVSHTLIFHGRRICDARKPACSTCPVHKRCPSAFAAENVGRKPKKVRAAPSLPVKSSAIVSPGKPTKKAAANKTGAKKAPSKATAPHKPRPSKEASAKTAGTKTTSRKASSTRRTRGKMAPAKSAANGRSPRKQRK